MKMIFSYLKKYRFLMAAAMLIKLAGTLGDLMIPYVLEHLVDNVVPLKRAGLIFLWGAVMLALAFLVRLLNVTANRLSVRVSKESIYEIRRDLFSKSMNLSGSQIDKFGLPSLTSRMTSDSYNVQSFIQSGQTLGVRAPILLLGGIAITMTMDRGLAMILCVMAPIMIVMVVFISMKGIPLYDKVQQSVDDIVRTMRENIIGIRVVKALSKEDYERSRFEKVNTNMARREMKASVIMSMPGPLVTLFLNVGLTLVVIIGAKRVNEGLTRPGVILAFLTYFNMILMGVMAMNRVFMLLSKANASANRIAAVINQEDTLLPIPEKEAAATDREGYIIFDHVSFGYGNAAESGESMDRQKHCLKEIDFSIKEGGTLGIIGATGCGKTTIVNLLMRFYDAQEGHIFIDGKDVRTYDKDELHRMFGVVFQNDAVFADTIRENIVFGREVSEEAMKEAALDAKASGFIERYADTYEHKAMIHGANFSGGQKQRLLISRAFAAKPKILVLDDSSSALDYKTDAALRKAIREHYQEATTLIIAQRVSSIMNLDAIIMLEEGEMIGYGTHQQLLESCKAYRDIYETQMGEM